MISSSNTWPGNWRRKQMPIRPNRAHRTSPGNTPALVIETPTAAPGRTVPSISPMHPPVERLPMKMGRSRSSFNRSQPYIAHATRGSRGRKTGACDIDHPLVENASIARNYCASVNIREPVVWLKASVAMRALSDQPVWPIYATAWIGRTAKIIQNGGAKSIARRSPCAPSPTRSLPATSSSH